MKKIILLLFLANVAFSQKYVVFENNKKNKALFDYNDPNSLVSLLVQNREKIKGISCGSSHNFGYNSLSVGTTIHEEGMHPIDGKSSFFCPQGVWEIDDPNNYGSTIPLRKGTNPTFKDWIDSLTLVTPNSLVEVQNENSSLTVFDQLSILMMDDRLKKDLEHQYNLTKPNSLLRRPDIIKYLDLDQIDLIFLDSSNVYFARKSPYENKQFITLILSMEELDKFERIDFLDAVASKSIITKLREFQLKKRETDEIVSSFSGIEPELIYDISEYESEGYLFNVYDENEFNIYKKTSSITKLVPGGLWTIPHPNNPGSELALIKESNASFQHWIDSLTIVTPNSLVEVQYNDPNYTVYDQLSIWMYDNRIRKDLERQYNETPVGSPIKRPNFEAIYWVDYPEPAVYLKRSFSKDTLGKFNTRFSQLLITERLNNKKGFNQKPQVLMSFGYEEEYGAPISLEILDLLKSELAPFNMKKEFAWQKIISNRQGKKISNDELKKLIHCYDIDDTGIQF
jgi:hypothetical protein